MNHELHKAVILARGLGSRMRTESSADLTSEQRQMAAEGVKAMISVGRPFLDHVMSTLADCGITEICLVIGPEHTMIPDYYNSVPKRRVSISFAIQEEPRGTADALLAAADFAGQDRVLVLNSDNFYPAAAVQKAKHLTGSGMIGFDRQGLVKKSNIPADRVAAFALARVTDDGLLVDLVEKPDPHTVQSLGDRAPVSMNCWVCSPSIFDACRAIGPSTRGEFELPDAIRHCLAAGEEYRVLPVCEGVLDLSNQDDIAAVAAALAEHEVQL